MQLFPVKQWHETLEVLKQNINLILLVFRGVYWEQWWNAMMMNDMPSPNNIFFRSGNSYQLEWKYGKYHH